MNVVLTGMKHCGKSTIGRALAARRTCPFYDVDEMIESTHACATGEKQSVRQIFADRGEPYFHKIEGEVICDLYMRLNRPGTSAVVSLGGRTALNASINRLLAGIGLIVLLRVPAEELFARVERGGMPPFLNRDEPREHFMRMCAEREPEYARLAGLIVDIDHLGVDEATDLLIRRLDEHARSNLS